MRFYQIKEGSVEDLEKDLKDTEATSYDAIDRLMKTIAKEYNITPKKLHDLFVEKHCVIPDEWIKNKLTHKTESAEFVDVWEMQEEDIRNYLLDNSNLFENTDNYHKFRDFISNLNDVDPINGKSYVYVCLMSLSPNSFLSIAHFKEPHKLLKIENGKAHFLVNGKEKLYPEATNINDNLLKKIIFFKTTREFEKFLTIFTLKFSDFTIKSKILDQQNINTTEAWSQKYKRSINCKNPKGFSQRAHCQGRKKKVKENFADGRNPQDKGDSKRYGVPTKGSISSLRKIAKQGGRKGQLAHWMANMKSGKRKKKTNESLDNKPTLIDMLEIALPIAMREIGLTKLPKIHLVNQVDDLKQPTFGQYRNMGKVIYLGIKNRHPLDIIRTLVHELMHHKQNLLGHLGPHSGDTGSPEENEAHAKAGIIMRHINKKHPEFFDAEPIELS